MENQCKSPISNFYWNNHKNLDQQWKDFVFNIRTPQQWQEFRNLPQVRNPEPQTVRDYANAVMAMAMWATKEQLQPPPRNTMEERDMTIRFANYYVDVSNGSPKYLSHTVNGLRMLCGAESFWSEERVWRKFYAGLLKRGKEPRWRFPWTSALARKLIDYAIDKLDDRQTALGYLIAFYGLARSGHFDTLLVSDVFDGDKVDWMDKVFPPGTEKIHELYIVRIKCRKRKFQGEMIRVPEYRGLIADAIQGRQRQCPLLDKWSPHRAIEIMNNFVEATELRFLGFRFDLHSLRCGGAQNMKKHGVPETEIKFQAKWSPMSNMHEHYAAAVTPEVRRLIEQCHVEEERLKGAVKTPARRTSQSNERLQRRLDYVREDTCPTPQAGSSDASDDDDFEGDDLLDPEDILDHDYAAGESDVVEHLRVATEELSRSVLGLKTKCAVCKETIHKESPRACAVCKAAIHKDCEFPGECKCLQGDDALRTGRELRQMRRDRQATAHELPLKTPRMEAPEEAEEARETATDGVAHQPNIGGEVDEELKRWLEMVRSSSQAKADITKALEKTAGQ